MKRGIWAIALACAITSGLMAGCTSTTEQDTEPCGKECSNQEVTESGCDEGATDLASNTEVAVEGLQGTIAIRMANPDVCEDLYWARFAPTEDSTSAFEVTLKVNGTIMSVPDQDSDPAHPTLFAWTKGYQAFSGDTLAACVTPEGQAEVCVEKTLP